MKLKIFEWQFERLRLEERYSCHVSFQDWVIVCQHGNMETGRVGYGVTINSARAYIRKYGHIVSVKQSIKNEDP